MVVQNALYTGDLQGVQRHFSERAEVNLLIQAKGQDLRWTSQKWGKSHWAGGGVGSSTCGAQRRPRKEAGGKATEAGNWQKQQSGVGRALYAGGQDPPCKALLKGNLRRALLVREAGPPATLQPPAASEGQGTGRSHSCRHRHRQGPSSMALVVSSWLSPTPHEQQPPTEGSSMEP